VQPVPPSISEAWPTRMPSMSVMALSITMPFRSADCATSRLFPGASAPSSLPACPGLSRTYRKDLTRENAGIARSVDADRRHGHALGICTMDSRASIPRRLPPLRGIPMTGRVVWAAMTPGQMGGKAGSRNDHLYTLAHGRFSRRLKFF